MVEQSGLPVQEAARQLGVHPSRVLALIHDGDLEARSVAGRWFVDPASVRARLARGTAPGRRLTPARAWGLLFLAEGVRPSWLDSNAVWKLRRLLESDGLDRLRPRLVERGRPERLRAHPSDLRRLREELGLTKTGVSSATATSAGLIASDLLDAYAPHDVAQAIVARYSLRAADQANVIIRVVPRFTDPWPLGKEAPAAAAAIDLAEDPDPRTHEVGLRLMRTYP